MTEPSEEYVVSSWLHDLANKVYTKEVTGLAFKWQTGTKQIEYSFFQGAASRLPDKLVEVPTDKSLN
jgi:hypothetical protein